MRDDLSKRGRPRSGSVPNQAETDWDALDPARVEEAKEQAAGPLGQESARFPLRFCAPLVWGSDPGERAQPSMGGATITLVRLGGRDLGLTCAHVVEGFRAASRADDSTTCQIGNAPLDVLDRLVACREDLDLAVLDLRDVPLADLAIADQLWFFEPHAWPPVAPEAGDFVALGGFPVQWKRHPSPAEVEVASFALGATMVTSVSSNRIACAFERQHWVQSFGPVDPLDLDHLGGMSGGPVFIHRGLSWDLVGIMYEYQPSYDLLFIRLLTALVEDGGLDPGFT